MQAKAIGRGVDGVLILFGAAIVALGLGTLAVGLFTDVGLRVGRIPVPLSIVGPLAAVIGLGMVVTGLRTDKCLACNRPLDVDLAYFPLEAEQLVVYTARTLDAARLSTVPMGRVDQPSVQVSSHACPACRRVAKLEIAAFRPEREVLIADHIVAGAHVQPLVELIAARSNAHEARYEAS